MSHPFVISLQFLNASISRFSLSLCTDPQKVLYETTFEVLSLLKSRIFNYTLQTDILPISRFTTCFRGIIRPFSFTFDSLNSELLILIQIFTFVSLFYEDRPTDSWLMTITSIIFYELKINQTYELIWTLCKLSLSTLSKLTNKH